MPISQYERSESDYVAPVVEKLQEDLKPLVLQQANIIKSLEARIAILERKLLRTQSDVSALDSRTKQRK